MRRCYARPPLLCGGSSHSLRSAHHRQWLQRALSAGGRRRVIASFRTVAVAPLPRRRGTRCRLCALRVCRSAASDAAVFCSATDPLWRRLALSVQCTSSSSNAFSLRAAVGESSRPSARSPSRCPRGAAARGATRALPAPVVPPHPMRRCCARPPLHCGGGSRSLRSALVVSGSARSLRAAVGGSSRPFGRSQSRRFRGAAARGADCARPASAVAPRPMRRRCARPPLLCGRGSRSLRSVIIASGGARSLRAVIGELSRPFGRSPSRCSRGAAARGAARALLAPAVPPHPMRRCCARPPILCGGGSRSLCSARRRQATRSLCGRPLASRRVLRRGHRRAAHLAPLHAAPLVRSLRPSCHRIRCGGVALGRRSTAAAARALCAVRWSSVTARALCGWPSAGHHVL